MSLNWFLLGTWSLRCLGCREVRQEGRRWAECPRDVHVGILDGPVGLVSPWALVGGQQTANLDGSKLLAQDGGSALRLLEAGKAMDTVSLEPPEGTGPSHTDGHFHHLEREDKVVSCPEHDLSEPRLDSGSGSPGLLPALGHRRPGQPARWDSRMSPHGPAPAPGPRASTLTKQFIHVCLLSAPVGGWAPA